eukprot:7215640-Prymnesium_polylepis.1
MAKRASVAAVKAVAAVSASGRWMQAHRHQFPPRRLWAIFRVVDILQPLALMNACAPILNQVVTVPKTHATPSPHPSSWRCGQCALSWWLTAECGICAATPPGYRRTRRPPP